jgi:pyruvate,water dikinase
MSHFEFIKAKEEYIELYGDRNLEELKLESMTFRTNPKLLDKKINEYRKDMDKLEKIYNDLNKEDSVEIHEDLITKFISKRAMLGIKNREISRLNRCRIYGMVRSMFLVFGNNLVKTRKLSKREDIFYLTLDELFNNEKYNLKELVKNRKSDYKLFYELPNYSRLIFVDREFDKHHKRVNKTEKTISKDILEGTPTSNGKVSGEALVIDDINKKYDVKDKILITKMTDPGWVFLIANSKGVISEKGSILSHTAIISRELKIPSIVGVEDATTIIKTGDYIKMDANTGKIQIERRGRK